jgi:hypothetical protein
MFDAAVVNVFTADLICAAAAATEAELCGETVLVAGAV